MQTRKASAVDLPISSARLKPTQTWRPSLRARRTRFSALRKRSGRALSVADAARRRDGTAMREGVGGMQIAGTSPKFFGSPSAPAQEGAPPRRGARALRAAPSRGPRRGRRARRHLVRASARGLRRASAAAFASARSGQDVSDIEAETVRLDALRKEISELAPRLGAGGRKARDALVRLLHEVSEPSAKPMMKAMGVLASASRLMKSPASDVELQRLAGSIITHLTGMPVSSEISDDTSGSRGQVNIVVPRASRVYGPDRALLAPSARSGNARARALP